MTSQKQLPERDLLPEIPYFTLDMHERQDADAIEVLLTGDLDDLTVGHLDDSLAWVVDHMPQRHVIVDVTGVSRLQPSAARMLVRVQARLGADRRTLTVRGEGAVRELLDEAGLGGRSRATVADD